MWRVMNQYIHSIKAKMIPSLCYVFFLILPELPFLICLCFLEFNMSHCNITQELLLFFAVHYFVSVLFWNKNLASELNDNVQR